MPSAGEKNVLREQVLFRVQLALLWTARFVVLQASVGVFALLTPAAATKRGLLSFTSRTSARMSAAPPCSATLIQGAAPPSVCHSGGSQQSAGNSIKPIGAPAILQPLESYQQVCTPSAPLRLAAGVPHLSSVLTLSTLPQPASDARRPR